jgi:hypothetical protein
MRDEDDAIVQWRRRRSRGRLSSSIKTGVGWALTAALLVWLVIAAVSGLTHP